MNGNWGDWGAWGPCEADCGDGVRMRDRQCNNPAPSAEGRNCVVANGTGDREREACNGGECQGGEPQGAFTMQTDLILFSHLLRQSPHLCGPGCTIIFQCCLFSIMSAVCSYVFISSRFLSIHIRLGRLLLLFPGTIVSIIFLRGCLLLFS